MHKQYFFYQNPFIISKDIEKFEILTSVKVHNSVEKFGKISCVGHNTAYTKFHKLVLKILNGNKILTSIKGHNSVEK